MAHGRFAAWLKKWFDDTAYRQNIEVVRENNLKFYKLYDSMMIGLLAALFASTLFSDYAAELTSVYIIFIVCSACELIYIRFADPRRDRLLQYATGFGIAKSYFFCLLSSVIFNRDAPAITYYIFLILIPVSFLLRPRRMVLIQAAATVVFCIATAIWKNVELVMGDSLSCVLFFAISIVIGGQISRLRMDNLSLAAISYRRSVDLENQQEVLTTALRVSNLSAWAYDCETHIMTPTYTPPECTAFGSVAVNMPEGAIAAGMVHPDSAEGLRALYRRADEGKTPLQEDFLLRGSAEDPFSWIQLTMIPQADPDGQHRRYVGTSEDVSERKKTELAYAEQLRILDSANETNLISKGRWNLTTNRQEFTRRPNSLTLPLGEHTTYDEDLQQLMEAVFPEEKRQEMYRALNRDALIAAYQAGTEACHFEYQRMTSQHRAIWVRMLVRVCRAPNDEDVMCFAFSYDITEDVMNRSIIDRLVSVEYDLMGTVDVNTGYAEVHSMQGGTPKAAEDHSAEPIQYSQSVQAAVVTLAVPEEQVQVTAATSLETVLARLSERDIYLVPFSTMENGSMARKKLAYCYLDDAREKILYYRSDITEMYQREQEQLRQTEAALETAKLASAAKTEFFSRMSHDMRTPMNGILGLANLSADETDPKALLENISKIRSSGEYLLGLINDTLDFQKIESGRMALYPEPVCARELIRGVMDMLRDDAARKGITFRIVNDLANIDSFVKVDPMRIKQIFLNLLSNAVKFTPSGGTVEIRVKSARHNGAMSHTVIAVSDTGIGMGDEFLRNGIFKPFSQEHNALSDVSGGTGLGLSIVKKLVELMHGSITVESEMGVGTTFTVTMDFELADSRELARSADNAQRRREEISRCLQGRHVLLAEDHPLNAEIATKLLQKMGVTVVWVKDGLACVDVFAQSTPGEYDAILMDIRMPLMDGLEAAASIRKLARADASAIPIIAMTANAYDDDVRHSMAVGMNAHLAKPIDPNTLYETLADNIAAL